MASILSNDKNVAKNAGKIKQPSHEQILQGFNDLRSQQRAVASKISELEMEKKEHDLVIEALGMKDIEPDRKCFRMVGGVLVERTVKEVLPALQNNREQLSRVLESLTKQLEIKGKDLNDYREKHKIRVRGEEDETQESQTQDKSAVSKPASSGILVAKDST